MNAAKKDFVDKEKKIAMFLKIKKKIQKAGAWVASQLGFGKEDIEYVSLEKDTDEDLKKGTIDLEKEDDTDEDAKKEAKVEEGGVVSKVVEETKQEAKGKEVVAD